MLLRQQLAEIEFCHGLHAEGVDLAVVDRFPHHIAVVVFRAVVDPVDEVSIMVVEDAGLSRDAVGGIAQSAFYSPQLLGFEVRVSLVATDRIEEFGKRRHAQRAVVRGKETPALAEPHAGVDAGINPHVHIGPTVLSRYESRRHRQRASHHVVLQNKLQVGAVESLDIVAGGAMDVSAATERIAEVGAYQVFVAQLGTERRTAECPVKPCIDVRAIDVGAVIVERHLRLVATQELKAVVLMVPVDRRLEMHSPLLSFSLQSRESLERMFKLIVELW